MAFLRGGDTTVRMVAELRVLLKELFGSIYDTEIEDSLVEFKEASFSATLDAMVVKVDDRKPVIQGQINSADNKLMWEFFKRWTGVWDDVEVFSWRLEIPIGDAVVFENVGIYAWNRE